MFAPSEFYDDDTMTERIYPSAIAMLISMADAAYTTDIIRASKACGLPFIVVIVFFHVKRVKSQIFCTVLIVQST